MKKITILGSGASTGVPMIGCHCAVCSSSDPRNQRLRPSALISLEGKNILIDAGPDFRMQALKYKIDHIDAVLLTHAHFDHVAGLDELRALTRISKKPMPLFCSESTLELLRKRYDYLFDAFSDSEFRVQLKCHILENGQVFAAETPISYVTYEQEDMQVNGFRMGDLAYICDIKRYSEEMISSLIGVNTLIIGALKKTPSLMHFSFEQAMHFGEKIRVKQMYLTHLSHEVAIEMEKELPEGVRFAYDGLVLEFK